MSKSGSDTVRRLAGIILALVLLVLMLSGCYQEQRQVEYITIGALLPLTGDSSDEGLRALSALLLAKSEINENGGILGKTLDIIVLNDRGDEEYILEQYRALMERDVVAIIGSSYSNVTNVLAEAAAVDGIPVISPTASHPAVTLGRPNVFRATFIDDYQSEAMARFAYNSLGAREALILVNRSNDGFINLTGTFARTFTAYGGEIVDTITYSSGDDFRELLLPYADMQNPPDLIYCPEDYIGAAGLLSAVYELGFSSTKVLGSDAWDGLLRYVFHPEVMRNAYYTTPFSFDDDSPAVARFVRDYFFTFSQMPLAGVAPAYTCVYILADAIERAGGTRREEIVSAMKATELDTIIGHIKFDGNNNPRTNIYIITIKDGIYATYEKLTDWEG